MAVKQWYAAEMLKGGIVTPATDVVGLAFIIKNAESAMSRSLPTTISSLLIDAFNSDDPQQRPSVNDFANALAQARKELSS